MAIPSNYIKFLELKKKSTFLSSLKLSPLSIEILETITLAESKAAPLTVGDLLAMELLGSSSTLHRQINLLLHQDFIALEYKSGNRRTKYLRTTKSTQEYFSHVLKLMTKASA